MSMTHGKLMELIQPEIDALVAKAYQLGSSDGHEKGMTFAAVIVQKAGYENLAADIIKERDMPF